MRAETKLLREAVKHIPGSWIRVYRDGSAWAGCRRNGCANEATMHEVKSALEAAGFQCECYGQKGTSGEYIIDVILRS